MDALDELATALIPCIAEVTGKTPVDFLPIPNAGGYTLALRRIVQFSDGSRAFVKCATSDNPTQWIAQERVFYETIGGASFLPDFYSGGTVEVGEQTRPFLLLEDLSACDWPRPSDEENAQTMWTTARVDAVLHALQSVRGMAARAPENLSRVEDELADFASWHLIAQAPGPFLSLGFCTEAWLSAALPTLIAAETNLPLHGDELLHLDVRSDNICFRPESGRAVLVDWNWASRGNAALDIAGWLPSLHSEGGPPPEAVSEEAGAFAAILSGFWAYRAGQPAPTGAPRVRVVQKQQLTTALPWAARVLNLPSVQAPRKPPLPG